MQTVIWVKCKRNGSTTIQSFFVEYILLWQRHLSFAGARSPKKTKLYHNRLGPFDYRIYYANIDLRHQYGISVGNAWTSPLAKRP